MSVNENTLEKVIITELQKMGYEYLYGPDIDRDYHEVILKDYFKTSMLNINPNNIFAEAGKKNPKISILPKEYMERICKMKHKNIAGCSFSGNGTDKNKQ